MSAQKYTYDDIVKVIPTGQIGRVKAVDHAGADYLYQIQIGTEEAELVEMPEAELELVKIANDDETGLTPNRYIT